MIKRYLEFIKESEEQQTLGELVETLYDDDYIKNIVNRYISEVTPDVRLSNAINILDEQTKSEIKSQIEEYQNNGIEEKEPVIVASTDTEELLESNVIAGKGVFTSFLKVLTALGQKDTHNDTNKCPDEFLLFYQYTDLNPDDVRTIFTRFKSLSMYLDMIDNSNLTELYFGIKLDGIFEYGISQDELSPIGKFKLSQSVVKWILQIDSKSVNKLKRDLVNLTFKDIVTLCNIKNDMNNFNPGYYESKSKPIITDRVISFGYYGVGKWDNGVLDEGELLNVKNNLSTFILNKKWGGNVLISVKPNSFWLYIHIKIK